MKIAKQKRRENIAEYILYLWQLEDMFRALEFSPEAIYSTMVEPHNDLDDNGRQELFFWYMDMVNLLNTEGKRNAGHIEHSEHLIADLNDLHLHLLQRPVGREYASLFAPLSAELPRLKAVLRGNPPTTQQTDTPAEISDIEACFRALYSVMLCRLKESADDVRGDKSTVSQQYINDVMELISPVIGRLAATFHAAERGEIDLYEGVE